MLCPSALRTPVVEAARLFARAHGHRVELVVAGLAAVQKRAASGERADVAIATLQGATALIGLGRGIEGSLTPLASSALALALSRQTPGIEVADRAALAHALTAARSLVLPDAGLGAPGGAQAAELLERLGITAEMQSSIRYVADAGEVAREVASGRDVAGIAPMSDLLGAREIQVLGPIIQPPTEGVAYAGLVVRSAREPDAARAFLAHLRTPTSAARFRAAGYVPLD